METKEIPSFRLYFKTFFKVTGIDYKKMGQETLLGLRHYSIAYQGISDLKILEGSFNQVL